MPCGLCSAPPLSFPFSLPSPRARLASPSFFCHPVQGRAVELGAAADERGTHLFGRHCAAVQPGEGGFKDRDLYVWCANGSDGILTAHPTNKGKELRDIEGKHGGPFGQEIMQNATEGTIKEATYWWPRPGSDILH